MLAQTVFEDFETETTTAPEHLRVLIVDDAEGVRFYVRQILLSLGFRHIAEAVDGGEALKRAIEFKADLVFLDIEMAPMSGLEFLKAVRSGQSPIRRDLPVIVLSVADDDASLGVALALDCNAFLKKPASLTEIDDKVRRVTSQELTLRHPAAYTIIPVPGVDILPMPTAIIKNDFDPQGATTLKILSIKVGTVLDADICTASGNVLLASGMLLTQEYADRLADIAQMIDLTFSNGRDSGA